MRALSGRRTADHTYSFTDEQVKFSVRFALMSGALMGGLVVGFLMSAFGGH